MVCTKEFALDETRICIMNAIIWAIKAKMDEHFISDLKHLEVVAQHNLDDARKNSSNNGKKD